MSLLWLSLLQNLHHLNRRKESDEIWGCRHMVEARHGNAPPTPITYCNLMCHVTVGMHPNGIPCSKKQKEDIEPITRDVRDIHI